MNYRQPFEGSYGISQRFGETATNPNGHTGIDYLCPLATPVLASESGTVIFAGWKNGGYGYCVYIKHPDGNTTVYEHLLSTIPVKAGQHVERSQVIGYSGTTGNSTGPHLHFEALDPSGKPFDPMLLPLHTSIEPAADAPHGTVPALKDADELGRQVEVVAPAGAKAWFPNFQGYDVFAKGTKLTYTGETCERFGYTYCECYPEPQKYWVAVHDGDCQILDNTESE